MPFKVLQVYLNLINLDVLLKFKNYVMKEEQREATLEMLMRCYGGGREVMPVMTSASKKMVSNIFGQIIFFT